ncbi:MAG: 6-phosphogluconolactonase [Acidobacteria bacterium]|nr:6-phosphogluconolactonase [Acidobacteriota bacterium]
MKTLKQSSREIVVCADVNEIAHEAANRFFQLSSECISRRGRFTVALSGGSTPAKLYEILSAPPFSDSIPWGSICFFWGDERCVPPDDPQSNYRLANEKLLTRVGVPIANIFRIKTENPPKIAAAEYSEAVRKTFHGEFPHFDLVFLGIGSDGHTASLFPGTDALRIEDQIAVANYVEKFDSWRVTLTLPALNNAGNVIFLVSGADKAETLRQVLEGEYQPENLPSQLIKATPGTLTWIIDEPAAGLLSF